MSQVKEGSLKLEDNETTSYSSEDSTKIKVAIFIRELRSNIKSQLAKNQAKLMAVIQENPSFSMTLYQPKLDKALENNERLLANKLDRLMEDQHTLDKQLSKISFVKQEDEQIRSLELQNKMDHYSFLRKIWKKNQQACSAEERIDFINHTVGSIKGHIKHMLRVQNKVEVSNLIKQSQQYSQLQQKLKELEETSTAQKDVLNQTIQQLQTQLSTITQQNQAYFKKMQEKKQYQRNYEQEVVLLKQKVQSLQIQIMHKDREIKKLLSEDKKNTIAKGDSNHQMVVQPCDKTYTLILKSNLITNEKYIETNRSFSEVKTFFEKNQMFEKIIQDVKNKIFDDIDQQEQAFGETTQKVKAYPFPNRKFQMEKVDRQKIDYFLGSQEKKRRFERTRME